MNDQQTFTKNITDKELSAMMAWAKEQPVPYKYFETIFNSILQLPDVEQSKNENKNKS